MPMLLVAAPQVYPWALFVVGLGMATRLVSLTETRNVPWRRWLMWTFPGLLALVLIVAGSVFGLDWLEQKREAAHPLPPASVSNVLLIVLDTVRADRLSLYGYSRPTTPALERVAKRAVRFAEARATASWTLASHASMFAGRLPDELGVKWQTPLSKKFPSLPEYFGARGYATSGFVANTEYCSYDTGLNRGFTHYKDYDADCEHLRPLRTAILFQSAWDGLTSLVRWTGGSRFQPLLQLLLEPQRKDAAVVNSQFIRWLSHRQEPRRPFFAFLNYFDAHAPYIPPEGTPFRFGSGPRTLGDFYVLVALWKTLDKSRLVAKYQELVRDSYDNCIAYLDGQLGKLFEALERRGVLDNTVVVITSDHGEELGEHGLFEHGESLYRPEIHVPLLFIMPGSGQPPCVVGEAVSLRDLPATIVELAGLPGESPFPGTSLVRLWRDSARRTARRAPNDGPVISELCGPNPTNPSKGRSPAVRGPLISLTEGEYVYIRNQNDGREQLFDERDDPDELVNLAKVAAMQPQLARLRERLEQIGRHPLRADR
jgi:arylsulfatase A-like enzyme